MMTIISIFGRDSLRRQIAEFCSHRDSLSLPNYKEELFRFAKYCRRRSITEVTKDDINGYHDSVLATGTQYGSMNAMKSIRCLFRYQKGLKVCCIDPSCITDTGVHVTLSVNCDSMPIDMENRHSTLPKTVRNRDLVLKRIRDPQQWSFGALGDFFDIAKVTAFKAFRAHATKYVTPQELEAYYREHGYKQ